MGERIEKQRLGKGLREALSQEVWEEENAYGLTSLPEASAYERWRSALAEPMDVEGFETFLRKLQISLSEDPLGGTNAMTAKHWPTMTAKQRKRTEEVYETYGKRYVYGS